MAMMVEFLWKAGGGVHLGVTAVPLPGPEVLGTFPQSSPCLPLHATPD